MAVCEHLTIALMALESVVGARREHMNEAARGAVGRGDVEGVCSPAAERRACSFDAARAMRGHRRRRTMLGMQAPGAFLADATVHTAPQGSNATTRARAARFGTLGRALYRGAAGGVA